MLHEIVDISRWKSVFNLNKLRSEVEGLHPNLQLGGMSITSPFHIAVVEQLREESQIGKSHLYKIPTDVFVWNLGEPINRNVTKIGGLPYRDANKEWLYSKSGHPLTFIAQICFSDSKDLVGSLPGDILLIFGETGQYGIEWDDDDITSFVFEWVSIHDFTLVKHEDIPETTWNPLSMYGSIFRTYDYPKSEEHFKQYNHPSFLSVLEATKINGNPIWIQNNPKLSGRFLCSLSSIAPTISGKHQGIKIKPYPYINRPEPIEFHEWYNSHAIRWGDMGILNIFIDESGKISWNIQCH